MRWDILKFWALVVAILAGILIVGLVTRGKKPAPSASAPTAESATSIPASPAASAAVEPSEASMQTEATGPRVPTSQSTAVVVLGASRFICATLAGRVADRWSSYIQGGSGSPSVDYLVEAEAVDTAKKTMESAEEAMKAKGVREGEAGVVLVNLYAIDDQLCALARDPSGRSLMTFNAEISRLASAADGEQARLKLLVPDAPKMN